MQPQRDVSLAQHLTIGVGGDARWFCEVSQVEQLHEALVWADAARMPVLFLGGGSNIVVSDAGIEALVVRIGIRGVRYEEHREHVDVVAAAGEPWDELVAGTVARDLVGLECLSGIPGLVGATPIQNVGAYGQEVGDTIIAVCALDRERSQIVRMTRTDCGFAYRDSRFKSAERERFVVLEVTYRLKRNAPVTAHYHDVASALAARGIVQPTPADIRRAVLDIRRSKSMLLEPSTENSRSCGSFFVNPVVSSADADAIAASIPLLMPRYVQSDGRIKLSAAWLIERAGFEKGYRQGLVGISTRHSLALVTQPGATASALLALAARIRQRVYERFGVQLTPEPNLWNLDLA